LLHSLQGDRARERFGLAVLPAVLSHAYLARALAERGSFEEGHAHGQEALRIAEALDHPLSVVWACLGQAYLNSTQGDLGPGARLLEPALALCRERSITTYIPVTMAPLGHTYARSGRIAEGVSLLQQALAAYDSAGIGYCHSISVVQLGEAYLLANQLEDASACADGAVKLTRTRGERGYEAYALRLLGEIAAHSAPSELSEAGVRYREALALADELGMRPLVAHCHFGLGKLYRRTDKREQAQEHLATATTMYREMGMTYWLEKAQAWVTEQGGR
jgi:tetratricopeptide (TPR) repeat protein